MLAVLFALPRTAPAQRTMVRVLVCTPWVEDRVYKPIADVMAGSIVREFNRAGGMEMIDMNAHDRWIKETGRDLVFERSEARAAGEALGADIVIYGSITKNYDDFIYQVIFYEVEQDVIQRTLNGKFHVSSSAMEIGRRMREESERLIRYIPMPSELGDISSLIVQKTVDPERVPASARIEGIPDPDRYGKIEQVLSYFRVFPGENEYRKLENQQLMMRFRFREDMDQEMTSLYTKLQIYGDFGSRHGLRAYMIRDCSTQALNVLLANGIPVFYIDGILVGYEGLTGNGVCVYRTLEGQFYETFDISHRKRQAVMFMAPKTGRRKGVSREFLDHAVGYYKDEWGNTPTLIEIKDGMLDISSGGMEE